VFLGDHSVGRTDSGSRCRGCLVLAPVLLAFVLVVFGVPGSDRKVMKVLTGSSAGTVSILGVGAALLCRGAGYDCSDLAR
jgi:hypothetical protein